MKKTNLYILQKMKDLNLTAAQVSTQMGLKSKSYLGLVFRGKRKLTLEQVHQLGQIFELSSKDFDIFFHTVLADQASSSQEKNYHETKLKSLSLLKSPGFANHESEKVLARWYYPALILHGLLDNPPDLSELSKVLKISKAELVEGIQDLQSQGLLTTVENGTLKPACTRLKVSKRNWNRTQKYFLKEQISNVLQRFDQVYDKTGKFYSQTLTIEKESFERIWGEIRSLLDEQAAYSEVEKPESMVQLNVQLYSLL